MVVALPPSHRLAQRGGAGISMSELATEDFVSYRRTEGPGVHDAVTAACQRAGFNAHIVEEVPRMIAATTMVAAGRGLALVPEALKAIHSGRVSYRSLDAQSAFAVPLNLAYRQAPAPGPIGHFIAIAEELRQSG